MKKLLILLQLALIASMYVVPYLFLSSAKDLSLFLFWTAVTVAIGVLCIIWLSSNEKLHVGEVK
ncbi:MAG: hypothetical protein QW733_00060 [Desulfurococcaceae archaeon]